MEEYRKYFEQNKELLEKLELLHEKKYIVKKLLNDNDMLPYVVDISGLPRTGKTVSVERVHNFFKQAGIKVEKAKEPAYLIKKNLSFEEIRNISQLEFNDKTLEFSRNNLKELKEKHPDIILMDRGVIDNYFWYQKMYEEEIIDKNTYEEKLLDISQDLLAIDQMFVLTAIPEIIIMRDFVNQLYLEARNKTTIENVTKLREAFNNLLPRIKKIIGYNNKVICLDTSNIKEIDTAVFIADKVMDGITKKLSL